MSDAVIIAIASGALAFLGILVNGVVAVLLARLNIKASAAAEKVGEVKIKAEETAQIVKEVKNNLEQTDNVVNKKLKDIHRLVNSNMGTQLKIAAAALKRIAIITKKKDDITAAEEAEALYKDHMAQQALIDGQKSAKIAQGKK